MDINFLNNREADAKPRNDVDHSCASILASLQTSGSAPRREGVDNCASLLASFHVQSPAVPSSEWSSFTTDPPKAKGWSISHISPGISRLTYWNRRRTKLERIERRQFSRTDLSAHADHFLSIQLAVGPSELPRLR
jgi:hypothetical protein